MSCLLPEELWLEIFQSIDSLWDFRRLACVNRTLWRISQDPSLDGWTLPDKNDHLRTVFWCRSVGRSDAWNKPMKNSSLSLDFQDVFFVIFETLLGKTKSRTYRLLESLHKSRCNPIVFICVFKFLFPNSLYDTIIQSQKKKGQQIHTRRRILPWFDAIKHVEMIYEMNDYGICFQKAVIVYLKQTVDGQNSFKFCTYAAKFGVMFMHWMIELLENHYHIDPCTVRRAELARVFYDYKNLRHLIWSLLE